MAILKIARAGHPALIHPAEAVTDPTSAEIQRLVDDMLDTLADAGGVGLAAPQVHISKRIVIFHVPAARQAAERYRAAGLDDSEGGVPMTVLINPEIEAVGTETAEAFESCLSLPGLMGAVSRPAHIRYRGLTLDGDVLERDAVGFHARVVQHECDHLDGILYPQRMADMSKLGYVEEMKHRAAAGD